MPLKCAQRQQPAHPQVLSQVKHSIFFNIAAVSVTQTTLLVAVLSFQHQIAHHAKVDTNSSHLIIMTPPKPIGHLLVKETTQHLPYVQHHATAVAYLMKIGMRTPVVLKVLRQNDVSMVTQSAKLKYIINAAMAITALRLIVPQVAHNAHLQMEIHIIWQIPSQEKQHQ